VKVNTFYRAPEKRHGQGVLSIVSSRLHYLHLLIFLILILRAWSAKKMDPIKSGRIYLIHLMGVTLGHWYHWYHWYLDLRAGVQVHRGCLFV